MRNISREKMAEKQEKCRLEEDLMKKMLYLFLALSLVLGLSACGEKTEAEKSGVESEKQEASKLPTDTQPQQEESTGREEHRELSVIVEGEEQNVPATLFAGEGYSLYIPDEGWKQESGTEEGFATVSWESLVNEEVELEILRLTGMDQEEARAFLLQEEDDFALIEDKRGGLGGTDKTTGQTMLEITLIESEGTVLAVRKEYPLEATEGFGAWLSAMEGSMEPGILLEE